MFFCETTKEVFLDYEAFFERTILCNSLVWSCSVTGKSNLTYEEAAESEAKSRKKISNLPKGLKKGLLYLVSRYLALPITMASHYTMVPHYTIIKSHFTG